MCVDIHSHEKNMSDLKNGVFWRVEHTYLSKSNQEHQSGLIIKYENGRNSYRIKL